MKLARPASEISLGEIIRKSETATQLVECMRTTGHCAIAGGCGLRGILQGAEERFFQALDEKNLTDAVGAKEKCWPCATIGALSCKRARCIPRFLADSTGFFLKRAHAPQ